ncbi:MAG: hypothetical protein KF836_07840 [Fimbriimonadaceae bacterium]|nr:hypothetical protein [Fimbriimonadaceae bacterium]
MSNYTIVPGTNPFVVHHAEDIPADEMKRLFVNVLSDFTRFSNPGHAMLHGPRGTGKSMILRYLLPDCQARERQSCLQELPFHSVYVGVKRSELGLTELRRLRMNAVDFFILEHLMVLQCLTKLTASLKTNSELINDSKVGDIQLFYKDVFCKELRLSGVSGLDDGLQVNTKQSLFEAMENCFENMAREATSHLKRLGFSSDVAYSGPLCSYSDTFLRLVTGIKMCGLISSGPLFLMVDDADLLGESLTLVLNSWIASRTTDNVCIKVTTQYKYKTYRTPSGNLIESPHDFIELDCAQVYTSKDNRYYNLVREIVQLRLNAAGLDISPEAYFPAYQKQEDAIEEERKRLISDWGKTGRGYRPSDDATRYARPNYIRSLKGTAKSGSSYFYAGFEQLVHVSSGVYRFFLAPASSMYESQFESQKQVPTHIEHTVQDEVVRDHASHLLYKNFEKIADDPEDELLVGEADVERLQNLVHSLGGIFAEIQNSDRSERRVTSIALSQSPTKEILNVLKLGVQSGYFVEATLGNKEGTGRTRRFILTKRLAPAFLLDPFGFAGYLFVTNDALAQCMTDPKRAISNFMNKRLKSNDASQMDLFGEMSDL